MHHTGRFPHLAEVTAQLPQFSRLASGAGNRRQTGSAEGSLQPVVIHLAVEGQQQLSTTKSDAGSRRQRAADFLAGQVNWNYETIITQISDIDLYRRAGAEAEVEHN